MNLRSLLFILLVSPFAVTVAHAQQASDPLRPGPSRVLWERPSSALSAERAREPLGGLLGPDDEDQRYPGFFVGAGPGTAPDCVGLRLVLG